MTYRDALWFAAGIFTANLTVWLGWGEYLHG